MSKIGRKPIDIPEQVEIKIEDSKIKVKGPKGELEFKIPALILVEKEEKQIFVRPKDQKKLDKKTKALWGTTRAHIANMIEGVTMGYKKELEMVGVGFRAQPSGNALVFQLGYSHPIEFVPPEGVSLKVAKNIITVEGIDKQKVGETAAKIRALRPPEPYKGTGIKYKDEEIRRKPGKAVAKEEGAGGE